MLMSSTVFAVSALPGWQTMELGQNGVEMNKTTLCGPKETDSVCWF